MILSMRLQSAVMPNRRYSSLKILGVASLAAVMLMLESCIGPKNTEAIWYSKYLPGDQLVEIDTIDPSTNQSQVILTAEKSRPIGHITLSPEMTRIAFNASIGNKDSVWLSDLDGSHQKKVSNDYIEMEYFWLDDQKLIFFGTNNPEKRPYDGDWTLYDSRMDTSTPLMPQERRVICPFPTQKGLSEWVPFPGNGAILGTWQVKGNTIAPVGKVAVENGLLDTTGLGCPSWSLDGNQIVIAANSPSQHIEMFFITDGGKTLTQLTHFGEMYQSSGFPEPLALSPDGHWVIAQVNLNIPTKNNIPEGQQIILVDTHSKQLYYLGEWYRNGNFIWSPDSKKVAVSLFPKNAKPEDRPEIHVIDTTTMDVRQLTFDRSTKEVFDWH